MFVEAAHHTSFPHGKGKRELNPPSKVGLVHLGTLEN